MSLIVVKADRDRDFYVLWSTTSDAPEFWGDRRVVLNFLLDVEPALSRREEELRLERADVRGSSAYIGTGYWNSDLIFRGEGLIPRDRLREFVESYDELSGEFDSSILIPFAEDDW
jgi:hypothetical protein